MEPESRTTKKQEKNLKNSVLSKEAVSERFCQRHCGGLEC